MATSRTPVSNDRRVALWVLAGIFVVILISTIFGPRQTDDDPEPTTYNAGTQGTKAAYLLLSELGYSSQRWESPATQLSTVDAAATTLILTQPKLPVKGVAELRSAIVDFLNRGGRVVATGGSGALLLPGGSTEEPSNGNYGLCDTIPEGAGALARVGQVTMNDYSRWTAAGPEYRVEQRCGGDAVVVRYRVGKGEAIWWSSPMPLTNAGLSDDSSLKLVLASIGAPGRTVLFDEYMHTWRDNIAGTLKGLPWWPLTWQCVAIAALLIFSFSRRSGPIRTPVPLPRSSPVEFAESMGRLYEKAGATQAATEAARTRLIEFLRDQCGIPRELVAGPAPEVAAALSDRFGGDWHDLEDHLAQAGTAQAAAVAPRSALKLVQSLEADHRRLEQLMQAHQPVGAVNR